MFSDAPYWRPPSRALSMVFQLETDGLEARFSGTISYVSFSVRPLQDVGSPALR
jgi:hypothetical protein